MAMNRKSLRQHEDKILLGLVDFYYEVGYTQDAYCDPNTGGIYEHKLANRLGYKLVNSKPPHEFIEAAKILESRGFVRRNFRKQDFDVMGIWTTPAGLDRAEYLEMPKYRKAIYQLKDNWVQITVSAIVALITTLCVEAIKYAFE